MVIVVLSDYFPERQRQWIELETAFVVGLAGFIMAAERLKRSPRAPRHIGEAVDLPTSGGG
jgi:hypothetical protein